ncbi:MULTISPECIES: hypothetical protein [unclassified Janthinobacterium]|uniref:hypothetical protein n=1 Tax=unclassified Janthinobacterium TaxID=2610881 RepID=UPI00271381FE|nr:MULTISPECIES: hypothetical protein [unclassified Janthinobacterium]MDO8066709.1 hypothetical protein [Janthinobacterium sp. SUN206]MDO8072940.1 hypothetical protein [Janthinobacterium sp. SUN176]
MNYRTPLVLLLVSALLGACSDKTAPASADVAADVASDVPAADTASAEHVPPPAATAPRTEAMNTPQARELEVGMMRAVFGKDYRNDSDDALADLSDPDNHVDKLSYVVSAISHKLLPDGRAILVANAETANTEGTAESAHASPGLLNVFFLAPKGQPEDGQWQVVKRLENIATLGSSGQLGEVHWVMLGANKPGLAIRHGYTGQGYTITQLALFEIGDGKVTAIDGGIDLYSDNMGACGPDTDECWMVDGKWRFAPARNGGAYDDLLIDFKGASEKIKPGVTVKPDEDPPRIATPLNSHARYGFDGKGYKLVEGKNTVPGV